MPATGHNAPLSHRFKIFTLRPEAPHDARHQAPDAPPLRRRARHRPHQERPPHGPQLSRWAIGRRHQRRPRRRRIQLPPPPQLAEASSVPDCQSGPAALIRRAQTSDRVKADCSWGTSPIRIRSHCALCDCRWQASDQRLGFLSSHIGPKSRRPCRHKLALAGPEVRSARRAVTCRWAARQPITKLIKESTRFAAIIRAFIPLWPCWRRIAIAMRHSP